MIDHDRLFKELLTTFFVEFIELFFPDVAGYLEADSIIFLDKELFTDLPGGERREADVVVKAQFRGQPTFFIIHIEHQSQAETDFSRRMFRYFARLYEQYELPVYPIALFSYATPFREEPHQHRVVFPNRVVLEFSYDLIQLNRLNWRDFVRQENPVASALMARMGVEVADRPRVKLECLDMLVRLRLDSSRQRLIGRFIDTYLRLNAEEELQFQRELEARLPEKKEAVMEVLTTWEERGLQRGLQQGREEGRRQEAVFLVIRQLTRRFGRLTSTLEDQIKVLTTTKLEELGEALLDFANMEELMTWLQKESAEHE